MHLQGPEEEWDDFIRCRPEGTFFHTRAWARLLLASFPLLEDRSLRLDDAAGPILVPLFAWKRARGLLTTLHSSYPFLYGGPIPAGPRAGRDPFALVCEQLRRSVSPLASLRLMGNPFAPAGDAASLTQGAEVTEVAKGTEPGREPRSFPGFRARRDFTHLMRLPASEDEFWEKTLTTAKRNDVRRLSKKGVSVEESRDPAHVDLVYGFYLASFARWGGRPGMVYPRAFYHNLCRLGGEAVRFTVAWAQGRIIGGTFAVRWNEKVHYLAGYFDHESRALRPNVLIQVESIRAAIREGYRFYDFLPSGGHATVETFKESFGGIKTGYPVYARWGILHRLLGRSSA